MTPQKNRVTLPKSERNPVPGATCIGPENPSEQLEVTVVLRRNPSGTKFPDVNRMGATSPRKRTHLTRDQFAKEHGASPADIAKVKKFGDDFGLKVVSENAARRSVVLSGTVANFNEAFETDLSRYDCELGEYRGRTGSLTIPAELKDIVEGVFGLDNRPQAQAHFRIRKNSPSKIATHASSLSYEPTQVGQAYNFPAGLNGDGECIGIVELGGGYQASDLDSFFSKLGLTTPEVTAVSVDGGANSPTGDASGPDAEVELDIEVAGAIAPAAKIAVYFAPNTDRGFIDAITTAIHDTKNKPSIISISWGGPESSWSAQSMDAIDSACQDAAAMGITVLAASGDNGASDGSDSGQLDVDFPSSSPHIVGCGGTKLTISAEKVSQEVVWNELSQQEGATGGGVSQTFALPDWQASANVPKSPAGKAGRGVPDVAGDADPATGYEVFVDGAGAVIGGTSAVAPLWAGLLALFNQSLKKPVGFINPLLYASAAASSFRDITSGNNDGYTARKGWDACTGLGSPDGAKLLAALSSSTSASGGKSPTKSSGKKAKPAKKKSKKKR